MPIAADLRALPRATWILYAGTFINRFGTFVMPFLVIYLTRSGYGVAQSAIAISAYGAGHLCASLLGGHLADRIGRRFTIAASMLISCAAMLALSQARTLPAIVAITFVAGAASEMYRPAAGALIGDLVAPEQRVTAFAMFRFALNLGFAAGPATAGLLADRSFTLLFIADAATSLAFALIALLALPREQPPATGNRQPGIAHALRNRPFVLFLLATLCITWIEYQVTSTYPLHLQRAGFSAKTYGFLISFNGALVVLFELAMTRWTQSHTRQRVLALGYALFAGGFALNGLARTIPALMLAVVIWTAGEMVFAPVMGAYVTDLAPAEYRGTYHGLSALMWSIGMFAGPPLGMLLFAHNAAVYFACVACAGLAAARAMIAARCAPPTAPTSSATCARRSTGGSSSATGI